MKEFKRVCIPLWVGYKRPQHPSMHYIYESGWVTEHPDGYFKPQGPGAAQLKGKHVLAVLDLCRVLAMGKGGDYDSTPTVNLSAAWDTEEVFSRL